MTDSTGTRARIQQVALELFTEQGYEKTSLREIAERLNVTKAALYYHFKSKDEIVNSIIEDRLARLDALIEWAERQPPGPQTRREILLRYVDDMNLGQDHQVMRFLEANQTLVKHLSVGVQMRSRIFVLRDILTRPSTAPIDRIRTLLALFAIQTSWFAIRDPDVTADELKKITLAVAYENLDRVDADNAAR